MIRRLILGIALFAGASLAGAAHSATIYWTDFPGGRIQRLDGSGVTNLRTGLSDPTGMAIDFAAGKIYWADPTLKRIHSANLDGSGTPATLYQLSDPSSVQDVALDVAAGKIYWCDSQKHKILKANLDGSGGITDVATSQPGPTSLELDLVNRHVYWADPSPNADLIRRADMDGLNQNIVTLVQYPNPSEDVMPMGLCLDLEAGHLYWTTFGVIDAVHRANLDGSSPVTLIEGLATPFHIALDKPAGRMYFTTNDGVQSANLNGTGFALVSSASLRPWGIVVVPCAGPTVTNPPARSVGVGDNTTFSVSATGTGLTYTWKKNGVAIPGAPNGPDFTIANVQFPDAGAYSVSVCNTCACVTSLNATLTVCNQPVIDPLPPLLKAQAGAVTQIISTTVTDAASLLWYHDGLPLTDGAKYSGVTTSTLTISNVSPADRGYYELHAVGFCGSLRVSNACLLDVVPCKIPTTVTSDPSSQTVALGAPASFTVAAGGCPPFAYQWQKSQGGKWTPIGGANSPTYTIAAVAAEDAGTYRCVVSSLVSGMYAYSKEAGLNLVDTGFLRVSAKAASCTAVMISWDVSPDADVYVRYGTDCNDLIQQTPTVFGRAGSVTITVPAGQQSLQYRVYATSTLGTQVTECATAFTTSWTPNLYLEFNPRASIVDYFGGTADGVAVPIQLRNNSCVALEAPFLVTEFVIGSSIVPKTSDGQTDVPRLISSAPLGPNEIYTTQPFVFLRSELPRGTYPARVVVQYGTGANIRSVTLFGKVSVP
jgi:hypothetical protein